MRRWISGELGAFSLLPKGFYLHRKALLEHKCWMECKLMKVLKESESEVAWSCLTLCNPVDCGPPGSSVHGILQARILEWVAISFSRGSFWPRVQTQVSHIASRCFTLWATSRVQTYFISSVQSLSRVWLFATPWITARQASLSITNSQSSLRVTFIESGMPSSHLILGRPLLLLPPIPPSIRVFSNESTLRMRWPKYWSFSFSITLSTEIPGLISFSRDWLDLLAV